MRGQVGLLCFLAILSSLRRLNDLQAGLAMSIGGMTESLVRQSAHAFITFSMGLNGTSAVEEEKQRPQMNG